MTGAAPLPSLARRLLLICSGAAVDTTPGGTSDALLLEDGVSGFQLEDGSGVLLTE